ncbi:MAG TPA: sigma-70 family RNA polymerase sigma factor [Bellilinea sp.]|nr:sigma-70 family RNA polymerase sigma factor [Bellilinea sp.]
MAEEQDWIEAARQGDVDGWERLVATHQQSIFRLAYLFLGDADDAEDITQETFIHAYRALNRFDSARPFRPWLMRIATNLCHNWHRSLRRYLGTLQNVLNNEPRPATILEQAEHNVDMQNLWKAVNRLPLTDQKVIYLRYFLECSEVETAEVLGVALGTVKSRSHRALGRMRNVLLKEYPHLMQESSDVA